MIGSTRFVLSLVTLSCCLSRGYSDLAVTVPHIGRNDFTIKFNEVSQAQRYYVEISKVFGLTLERVKYVSFTGEPDMAELKVAFPEMETSRKYQVQVTSFSNETRIESGVTSFVAKDCDGMFCRIRGKDKCLRREKICDDKIDCYHGQRDKLFCPYNVPSVNVTIPSCFNEYTAYVTDLRKNEAKGNFYSHVRQVKCKNRGGYDIVATTYVSENKKIFDCLNRKGAKILLNLNEKERSDLRLFRQQCERARRRQVMAG